MNKLQNYLFILSFMLLVFALPSKGQVTMGSVQPPAKGALLQLKQWETSDNSDPNDKSNSDKGLGMPRVALKSLHTLEPIMSPSDSDYETEKKLAQGMIVYNVTNKPNDNLEPGIYLWNGIDFWVRQDGIGNDFHLKITPDVSELIFPSGLATEAIVPQDLAIDWLPKITPTQFELIHLLNGGIDWLLPNPANTGPSNTTGQYTLTVNPKKFTVAEIEKDPFLEKNSVLSIITYNLSGISIQQDINIIQRHNALVFEGFHPYMDLGRSYPITIKTNSDWVCQIIDGQGVLESTTLPTNAINAPTYVDGKGVEYAIKLKNDPSKEGEFVTVKFTSPTGQFAPQEYTFTTTQIYSNSYIIKPGVTQRIPVRKAFAMWANDMDTDLLNDVTGAIGVQLVWQDKESLIPSASLKLIQGGSPLGAMIEVTPGNIEGNASVAFTIGGKIYWSWHLWVMNYDPNSVAPNMPAEVPGAFDATKTPVTSGDVYARYNGTSTRVVMDRNLGSTSVDPKHPSDFFGYFFQWGRKDPIAPNLNEGTVSTGYAWTPRTFLAAKKIYNINNIQLKPHNQVVHDNPALVPGFAPNDLNFYGAPDPGFIGVRTVFTPSDVELNLINSIHSPMDHYLPAEHNDQDWYGGKPGVHNEFLWGQKDGLKGNYDPCPKGWRVLHTGPGSDGFLFGTALKVAIQENGPRIEPLGSTVNPSKKRYEWHMAHWDFTAEGFGLIPAQGQLESLQTYSVSPTYAPFAVVGNHGEFMAAFTNFERAMSGNDETPVALDTHKFNGVWGLHTRGTLRVVRCMKDMNQIQ